MCYVKVQRESLCRFVERLWKSIGYRKKCVGFGETKSGLRKGDNDIKVTLCEFMTLQC